jgi:hypothetical protein
MNDKAIVYITHLLCHVEVSQIMVPPTLLLAPWLYHGGFIMRKALPRFFLYISCSLTCLKKLVFSKWDLLPWKVTTRLHGDLLISEAEGTSQPVTISKK